MPRERAITSDLEYDGSEEHHPHEPHLTMGGAYHTMGGAYHTMGGAYHTMGGAYHTMGW